MVRHVTAAAGRWLALLTLCLVPATAMAQTGLATVTGIVADDSGGAMPGVSVTATNTATNVPFTGVTNSAGVYTITSVPIGEYVVKAELQGFKTSQSTITLAAAQTARVDFAMEIGDLQESVEVTATAAVLQTENAVVGTQLEREQVEKLPVQGRNLSTATLYTAGVTSPNPSSFNSLKNTGGGRPYVNGQREQGNNFMLDGVDMNDAIDNLIAYQPSPDAVEQVRVETNNYSPEMGNVAGAIVNMVLKSGTNQIAGNGFWYWRDNQLAATPWATNRAGGRKSEYTRDIFGGTIGGPLVRNKVFWFADYQGGRAETPPADSFATVIPDAWRNGDLSSLLASNIIVRDPMTGQPFPNNQIPVSRFGQIARNLLANEALYPRANVARPLSDFRLNYLGEASSEETTNQFDMKVDVNASQNDKFYVRYSRQTHEALPGSTAMPLIYGNLSENPFWSWGGNWNRIIGRNLVNDLLIGYNDNSFNGTPADIRGLGPLNSTLGHRRCTAHPGSYQHPDGQQPDQHRDDCHRQQHQQRRLPDQRAPHVAGGPSHAEVRRVVEPVRDEPVLLGQQRAARVHQLHGQFSGVPFADFLLDQVSSKGRGSLSEPWTHLQNRIAFYVADDFKATNNLTLNLGMRWGFTSPLVERDDRQANFSLTNLEQQIAGQNGNSRALYEPYYNGWEPRLGFAYRKGERWVFRGATASRSTWRARVPTCACR